MVRPNTQLHPSREIAPLREAATVLLWRDADGGPQVLMTRRSQTASFAPNAYVFPGGGVDAADRELAGFDGQNRPLAHTGSASSAINSVAFRDSQPTAHRVGALAAIRESFEELGILLARRADGAWCTQADIESLDRHGDFYAQIQARGWQLAADSVVMLAHWVTDRDMPKRFDVPFFAARMPDGQTPVADESEQFAPEWVSPREALARYAEKKFLMIYPTVRTLERLATFESVEAILAACMVDEQPLWTSCPRAGLMRGKESRHMEHEPPYGELALVCPQGQMVHELAWQTERPVPLLKHVARLTAPNPSMMTGPGTNSYLVGTSETGYVVIDPGPDIAAHIQRLFDATQGDIRAIVCTHSHADHSPGAKPLQALCAAVGREVKIYGIASAPTSRASAYFVPDVDLRLLSNQELLTRILYGPEAENALKITLTVMHTPGHAANHVCLVLEEDGLLFSGDHILNGSTSVIDPPDGDMTAYLDSLDALAAACDAHDIRFILPAHGYVLSACDARKGSSGDAPETVGGARRVIEALKAHRLKREAKVAAAMKIKPGASVEDLVPLAYDDMDSRLWPIAARSLTAHVQRLQALSLGQQ
jgi:recombination protein RecT